MIDTERGTASNYSSDFKDPFDTIQLGTERVADFSPARFIGALSLAQEHGYDTVIIDSLSHAWMGKGGMLEQADKAAKRQGKADDTFRAWRDVTPEHNKLVDAVLNYPGNVIVTLRAKTKREIVYEDGKAKVKTLGTAVVFRDGIEYEFDVTAEIERDTHILTVEKTRIAELNGFSEKYGEGIVPIIRRWQESEDVGRGEVLQRFTADTLKVPYLAEIKRAQSVNDLMDIYSEALAKGIDLAAECRKRRLDLEGDSPSDGA